MVVEGQPVDHFVHRLPPGGELAPVQSADLQTSPQALRGRVVPAVTLAAHRRAHPVPGQRLLELVAAVLATAIRVHDQPWWWSTAEPRHAQRVSYQAGTHVGRHAPAHDHPAAQVDEGRQIQPTFVGSAVGDVARPLCVGFVGREVPLQQVWRDRQVVLALGGDDELRRPRALMPCCCIRRRTRSLPTR